MIIHRQLSFLGYLACFSLGLVSCGPSASTASSAVVSPSDTIAAQRPVFLASKVEQTPLIDGRGDDLCWQSAEWLPLTERWLGEAYSATDFSGRYKLSWSDSFVYILAEIMDDTLIDIHADGLDRYWDDDCLEVFIDENRSGGNHQYTHNAFAYHIGLDGRVVDVGLDSAFRYYDHHLRSGRLCDGPRCTWEVALRIYPDTYRDDEPGSQPLELKRGKKMGFALAYCDNDHSPERENFIGNAPVFGEDKNRGWIDAGIFGLLELR